MTYGEAPKVLSRFEAKPTEMMFTLYMPVYTRKTGWRVPANMFPFHSLLHEAADDFLRMGRRPVYAYATVKTLHCAPGCEGGRPGWHTDGFGTDDINYIWCDRNPTVFCVQDGLSISDDEHGSMRDMEEQCTNRTTYPVGSLLRLTPHTIHRIADDFEPGMRTFWRLSFSDRPYNLEGNSRNPEIETGWEYLPRAEERNPTTAVKR